MKTQNLINQAKNSEQISRIKFALGSHDNIFVENVISFNPVNGPVRPDPAGNHLISFYWPRKTSRNSNEGLSLIDNLGRVSLEIVLSTKDGRSFTDVKHTFRYINTNYIYSAIYDNGEYSDTYESDKYSFRFDRLLQNPNTAKTKEPIEHLQIMHDRPLFRYSPVQTAIEDFFEVLERTFWEDNDSGSDKLLPVHSALFAGD